MAGWLGLRTQPHFAAVRAHTIGFLCANSHHASSRYQIERTHGQVACHTGKNDRYLHARKAVSREKCRVFSPGDRSRCSPLKYVEALAVLVKRP
jgi:hypothetical protein